MAIHILRRGNRSRPVAPAPLPIGEPDSEIFGCPVCARPLAVGAWRCQGCGTRLVMRVPAAKASVFAGVGLVAGIVIATVVTIGVSALGRPASAVAPGPLASAAASDAPAPSPSPRPSASPDSGVPSLARSSLAQAVDLDARLAESGVVLAGLAAAPDLDAYAVARELRSMASAAAQGTALAPRVASWQPAAGLGDELAAFYGGVRQTARDGLKASMTNDHAYRAAAEAMLLRLAELPGVDERVRELAAEAGVDLQ